MMKDILPLLLRQYILILGASFVIAIPLAYWGINVYLEALTCGKPVLIDCMIDCDDKVWPMVAPGAPISEAFDEQDLKAKEN